MAYFTANAARRLVKSAKQVEQTPQHRQPGPTGPSPFLGARDAYTTSVIDARNGNKLGSGTFKYVRPGGSDGITMTYTGEPEQTAYNNTGGTIESDTYGYVMPVAGKLRFIEADCLSTTNPGAPAAVPEG